MDDDYDPLAPVHVDEEAVDDDPNGFSDSDHLVRIWLEDDRLSKVRLVGAWRRKLGSRRLEDCFGAAFAVSRIRAAGESAEPEPVDLSRVDFRGLPRFGKDPFVTFRLALENLNRRWQEVAAEQRAHPAEPIPPAMGEVEGVRVTLNADGRLQSVDFDEEWLEEAAPGEISDAVLHAARKAYDAHVPVPGGSDELTRLAREHEILMSGFMTMLNGRRG